MSDPFQPMPGKSTSIPANATSASASVPADAKSLRIYNAGTVPVFIRWGRGSQTAVTTDMALAPGSVELFYKGAADTVAAICASGSATVYLTPGAGE
jgi:hypothetical protein